MSLLARMTPTTNASVAAPSAARVEGSGTLVLVMATLKYAPLGSEMIISLYQLPTLGGRIESLVIVVPCVGSVRKRLTEAALPSTAGESGAFIDVICRLQ